MRWDGTFHSRDRAEQLYCDCQCVSLSVCLGSDLPFLFLQGAPQPLPSLLYLYLSLSLSLSLFLPGWQNVTVRKNNGLWFHWKEGRTSEDGGIGMRGREIENFHKL